MKIIKNEEHQLTRTFTYDIPDADIQDAFGSVARFKEIISHNTSGWDNEPIGEEPSSEEFDLFYEFFSEYDFECEDDIWTDRKGGYEVSYQVGEE